MRLPLISGFSTPREIKKIRSVTVAGRSFHVHGNDIPANPAIYETLVKRIAR